MPTQIVGQKSMVSGMNSTIKLCTAKKGEFYTTDGSTWFYRDAAGKM